MPELVTHVYCGDRERHYPYPPIMRVLRPGDEIDLDPAEVPEDIPLRPKSAAPRRKTPTSRRKLRTRTPAAADTAAAAAPADRPAEEPAEDGAGQDAASDPASAEDADSTPPAAASSSRRSARAPQEVDR